MEAGGIIWLSWISTVGDNSSVILTDQHKTDKDQEGACVQQLHIPHAGFVCFVFFHQIFLSREDIHSQRKQPASTIPDTNIYKNTHSL